ncbi:MAG: NAD(P)-binding domain-containing protein [Mycobacterium sp.]
MIVQTEHPVHVPDGPATRGSQLKAGVIGLGMIGGGVAVSLARSGRVPAVYDVRADAAGELAGVPAISVSPAEVARGSDVVLVAVVDATQVRAVLAGPEGVLAGAHPGLIVVVLSTVAVPEVHEIASLCAEAGVALIDCGVTPGDQAARNGLVAMVGGDDCTVRRAMPVLSDFAKRVVHCGPLGAGMATKIARNVITFGSWRAAHEAAELARSAGVAPQTLIDVVEEADPQGATLFQWLRHRFDRPPGVEAAAPQVLRLMEKDLAAAQDLARDSHVDVPLVDAARDAAADTVGVTAALREAGEQTRSERGLATMDAVYGAGLSAAMPADRTPTLAMTIDHLFGEVWSRPGLSIRDRRLLVLGATAALGRPDLIETQARGALVNGELTEEELEEAVLQLHYYVGWGNGTAVQSGVAAALANRHEGYLQSEESVHDAAH